MLSHENGLKTATRADILERKRKERQGGETKGGSNITKMTLTGGAH